jgi:hypothetical protein
VAELVWEVRRGVVNSSCGDGDGDGEGDGEGEGDGDGDDGECVPGQCPLLLRFV